MSTIKVTGTAQGEHDLRRRNIPQVDANGKAPGAVDVVDEKKTRKVSLVIMTCYSVDIYTD